MIKLPCAGSCQFEAQPDDPLKLLQAALDYRAGT
jgi:hypothetical protein